MPTVPGDRRTGLRDPTVEDLDGRKLTTSLGFVRARNDPEKRGRIQVWVPSTAMPDAPNGWLDWCDPQSGGAAINVPPDRSPVWVTYEEGYVQNGIYTWGPLLAPAFATKNTSAAPLAAIGQADPTWIPALQAKSVGYGIPVPISLSADPATSKVPQYPYNKVYQSESGVIVELDDSPGQARIRVYHPAGTTVLIDNAGTVQIRAAGAINLAPKGDLNVLLGQGSSFKVTHPNSSGFSVGPNGITLDGPQLNVMGRAWNPGNPDNG